MRVLEQIENGRIIAILRGDLGGREIEIVQVLTDEGITAVEVTMNSPRALEAIRRLAERFSSQMAIGAGTVLNTQAVELAMSAGAQFIVSPNRDRHVIAAAKRRNVPSFPGCFTPSEIVEAINAGAAAAKLFPAQCLGVPFIKAMSGPLPDVRLVPTGGVTPEAAHDYLAAGAWAVGVGSELFGKNLKDSVSLEPLRNRVKAYVAAAKRAMAV